MTSAGPAPSAAAAGDDRFTAQGNEPGWSLRISGTRLQLDLDYGARQIEAELPSAVEGEGTITYRLADEDVGVTIRERLCRDDMTGMPYPAEVTIETGGRTLRGCGGESRSLLDGPEWAVALLDGAPLPEGVSISIMFLEDDRVAGHSGCNRFMGGYQLTGEGLSFGQLAGTMMACPPPQMEVEREFLTLMGEVVRFDRNDDGALVLETASGQRIVAERSPGQD
jgi:heat shock protein HslJ